MANDPRNSGASLRRLVATTHPDKKTIPKTMPEQALEPDDATDVIRYVLALRGHR
jgi:hypothetical protein